VRPRAAPWAEARRACLAPRRLRAACTHCRAGCVLGNRIISFTPAGWTLGPPLLPTLDVPVSLPPKLSRLALDGFALTPRDCSFIAGLTGLSHLQVRGKLSRPYRKRVAVVQSPPSQHGRYPTKSALMCGGQTALVAHITQPIIPSPHQPVRFTSKTTC